MTGRSLPLAALLLAAGVMPSPAQVPLRAFTLPGGLRVVHREDQGRALFRARLRLPLRPADLPPGKEGVADLALRMMDRGEAGHLDPTAFDLALDEAGIHLTRTLTAEAITWDLLARGRDQDRALALLADRILRPVLDPTILEPQRLACWKAQVRALAPGEARLRAALGLAGPPPATEKSLGSLTFQDLETFLRRVFRPDRAVLALGGDLGPEQAKALVLLSFGTWTGEAGPPVPPAAAPRPPVPPVVYLPDPGASLRLEAAAPPPDDLPPGSRDLVALLLAADPGLAPLDLAPRKAPETPLRFVLRPPVGLSADGALALLRERLAALARKGYTEADLARAKAAWTGRQQVRFLHPQALLAEDLRSAEGAEARPEDVEGVTLAALNGALARWLDPARLRLAVLGDPKDLPTR